MGVCTRERGGRRGSTDLCMGGCGQKHDNEKINKNEYGNGNARGAYEPTGVISEKHPHSGVMLKGRCGTY